MSKTYKNLTIIIVTYKTNLRILEKCLDSIQSGTNVIIIENSKKFQNKNYIIKKYNNIKIKIYYSGKNIGYGRANNLGLLNTKTNFALISNPDVIFSKKFFRNILKYMDDTLDFSLIGIQYKDNSIWDTAGYFNKKIKVANFNDYNELNLQQVHWIIGCCMLIKLKQFKNKKIFDPNYFLYFEEFDICQKLKKIGHKVFTSRDLIIKHLGFKSSQLSKDENSLDYIKIKNWHFMWSFFYYNKKNYGSLKAYRLSLGKLLRYLVKTFFYLIIFNKKNYIKNLYNFLGLFNSMMGKKSFFRIQK
jgi:N-acetylglucosaminyl-diphospho-decaprenol L-rhamnosyltransferase